MHLAEPRSRDVCAMLDRAGGHPKHIVSDRGAQFQEQYRAWCALQAREHRGDRARLRFAEARDVARARARTAEVERHVAAYVEWYDAHRPHRALGGRTPREVRDCGRRRVKRIESRARCPAGRGVRRTESLALRTGRLRGEPRLHVFEIEVRRAA
ncbi:MAG: integrase core domain-containing protein [Myxococcales bacterium]|nr:integrase core domain-containing protein [Myxococcales bacterium]